MTSPSSIPIWQDRLGRSLMYLAALGALAAFGIAIVTLVPIHPDTVWLEIWQTFGLLMFAAMFTLLALRPRRSPGLWELAFFHKAALAVSAIFLRDIAGVLDTGIVDAILAMLLLVSYFSGRGWLGWSR